MNNWRIIFRAAKTYYVLGRASDMVPADDTRLGKRSELLGVLLVGSWDRRSYGCEDLWDGPPSIVSPGEGIRQVRTFAM